jgi:hypothetical protein
VSASAFEEEPMRVSRNTALMLRALAFLVALSAPAFADENPMWRSGYEWACVQGESLTCERGDICAFRPSPAPVIEILFQNSEVRTGSGGLRIKRHYSQRINGSPLTDEVKIELSDNSVIWLSPVDAGGTWSRTWTGMIVEPKRGAVLSVSRPLYCAPKS